MNWEPMTLHGWGRVARASVSANRPETEEDIKEALLKTDGHGIITYGGGRSYGDVALLNQGKTLLTDNFNRVRSFDPTSGTIVCEAGVTFYDLLREFLPKGYLVPTSPGTGFVTIAGAVANDVHGKDHDKSGSFGDHVLWIDLLLPSGQIERVSTENRHDIFVATIGGLGLTGVMLAICFKMKRVPSNAVELREKRIPDLDGFFDEFEKIRGKATYSIAWIDTLAKGGNLGRGILETADLAGSNVSMRPPRRHRVPVDFPEFTLNRWSVSTFNYLYYRRVPRAESQRFTRIDRFLYPLDAILEWNRIYGKRGFYQFQCVVPQSSSREGIRALLDAISKAHSSSFLSVLKTLGGEGRGYLSFPLKGYTLALDIPRKPGAEDLFANLEKITLEHGGRIYLAKDACLSPSAFESMYPKLNKFRAVLDRIDPDCRMKSDLALRLNVRGKNQGRKVRSAAKDNPPNDTASCPKIFPRNSNPEKQRSPINMNDQTFPNTKPELMSVEDAKNLTVSDVADLFCKHMNPGQYHFLKLLGFNDVLVDSAEGMYYTDKSDRKILDFFGGFGSLAFGHNHPRILQARKRFQEEKRHEIAIAFMSQYATALAKNLASIAPEDLNMVFLASTGSEAVEAALKLAEKAQGPERAKVAYAELSFHGKTRGALSVTDSEMYQSTFRLLDNRVRIPFGDAAALEAAFQEDSSIGALILETVQGGAGIVSAPLEYWKEVRRLCDQYSVVWIADEVQCGVGRTGRFFAFEHAGVVPDIVTLAKSLGGGKTAMGAFIAKEDLYMKAYGNPKTALIHGPATFGGIGEACCTSIEALNILYDEGLIEKSAAQGAYLSDRLHELQSKYPRMIKEVRGQGLMVGIEFCDFSKTFPLGMGKIISGLDNKLKGSVCGFVGSLLLREHNILVAFTEYNRNVIRLEPPLIVTREQIDILINALDDLLSRGITKIILSYIKYFRRKG